jgi:hypothetical protein
LADHQPTGGWLSRPQAPPFGAEPARRHTQGGIKRGRGNKDHWNVQLGGIRIRYGVE